MRKWACMVILSAFVHAAGWYYASRVYARPIARYVELQACLGRRVTFRGEFDGGKKAYDLVILDGHPIVFHHTLGGIEWSPDDGEVCHVVGVIEAIPVPILGIPYRLSQAEYFPVRETGDR